MGYEKFYFTNTLPQIKRGKAQVVREKKQKTGSCELIICESDFDVRWIGTFLDRTPDKSSHHATGGQY